MSPSMTKEEKFYRWLSGRVPASRLSDYYVAFEIINKHYQQNLFIDKSIFETEELNELNRILIDITNNNTFKQKYPSQHYISRQGLIKYIDYIKEKSKPEDKELENGSEMTEETADAPSSADSKGHREDFHKWLVENLGTLDDKSIIRNLDIIDGLLQKKNAILSSIYEIESKSELDEITSIVKKNEVVRIGIPKKHKDYTYAVDLYSKYIARYRTVPNSSKTQSNSQKTEKEVADPKQSTVSQRAIDLVRSMDRYKTEKKSFEKWMAKQGYAKGTIKSYINGIEIGSQRALLEGDIREDIILMQNNVLKEIYESVCGNRSLTNIPYFKNAFKIFCKYKKVFVKSANTKSMTAISSKSDTSNRVTQNKNVELVKDEKGKGDSITDRLTKEGIAFVDRRDEGGKLFVNQSAEADLIIQDYKEIGIEFNYSSFLKAWWTRDSYNEIEQITNDNEKCEEQCIGQPCDTLITEKDSHSTIKGNSKNDKDDSSLGRYVIDRSDKEQHKEDNYTKPHVENNSVAVKPDLEKPASKEHRQVDKGKAVKSRTASQGRREFTNWLKPNNEIITVANTSWTIVKISDMAIECGLCSGSLYVIDDIGELEHIFKCLEEYSRFQKFKLRNELVDFAIEQFLEFRKSQFGTNSEELLSASKQKSENDASHTLEIPEKTDTSAERKDRVESITKDLQKDNADKSVITKSATDAYTRMEYSLYRLLQDEQYAELRDSLVLNGIFKMQQFEDLNLWVFMNQNSLYSINQRFLIYHQLKKDLEQEKPSALVYQIKTDSLSYNGTSPAEAFLRYCESASLKSPLKFRSLIGKTDSSSGEYIIKQRRTDPKDLVMTNPLAYIDASIDSDTALRYAKYVCSICHDTSIPISIDIRNIESMGSDNDRELIQNDIKDSSDKEIVVEETVTENNEVDTVEDKILKDTEREKGFEDNNSIIKSTLPEATSTIHHYSNNRTIVEEKLLSADLDGMTLHQYYNSDSSINMAVVRHIFETSPNIISMGNKYVHVGAFLDFEEAADNLQKIIEKLLDKNDGYVSSSQLYEYARSEMQMFLNDNDIDDESSVFYIAQHLFGKVKWKGFQYVFTSGNHISRKGKDALYTNMDVFKKFARDRGGFFEYEALIRYLEQVGIKTGNLRGQLHIGTEPYFLYYSSDEVITNESMHIDANWISNSKKAFERLFDDVGDHIVLRTINPMWFEQLPSLPANRPWTPLLLQYIVHFYGKQLGARTIQTETTQKYDTLHAMLVSDKSELITFADAVVAYIVDQGIEQRKYETEQLRRTLLYGKLINGGELLNNLPKAIGMDPRFAWDAAGKKVTIRV